MTIAQTHPPQAAKAIHRDSGWSGRVIAVCLIVITLIVAIAALRTGRAFAVPTVLACLLALALAPLAAALERLGAPRRPTAFTLVFGAVAVMSSAVYVVSPSLDAMLERGPEILRELERTVREVREEVNESTGGGARAPDDKAAVSASDQNGGDAEDGGVVASGRRMLSDTLLEAPGLLGSTVYGVFLAFFLLGERRNAFRGLLMLAGDHRARLALGRAMRDVRFQVASYLFAITGINIALGVATGGAFWLLGMPDPVVWGALMTLLNFMPYLGPVIMNVIVIGVGMVALPHPQDVVWPVAALVTLNTLEGYLLTPSVVGRQVRVGPLAVFFAVAFGAWLWGAAGALIATPALIVLRAVVRRAVSA